MLDRDFSARHLGACIRCSTHLDVTDLQTSLIIAHSLSLLKKEKKIRKRRRYLRARSSRIEFFSTKICPKFEAFFYSQFCLDTPSSLPRDRHSISPLLRHSGLPHLPAPAGHRRQAPGRWTQPTAASGPSPPTSSRPQPPPAAAPAASPPTPPPGSTPTVRTY
jgi:hypothetical protein